METRKDEGRRMKRRRRDMDSLAVVRERDMEIYTFIKPRIIYLFKTQQNGLTCCGCVKRRDRKSVV